MGPAFSGRGRGAPHGPCLPLGTGELSPTPVCKNSVCARYVRSTFLSRTWPPPRGGTLRVTRAGGAELAPPLGRRPSLNSLFSGSVLQSTP